MPRARAPAPRPRRCGVRVGTVDRRHPHRRDPPARRRAPPPPHRVGSRATVRSEGDPDDSSLAGHPLRRAPPAARADLQPGRGRHARLHDRRHDGCVHGGQRRPAARAAVPRSEPPGAGAPGLPADVARVFAARLPGVRGARRLLRSHRGIPQPRVRAVGRRAAGAGDRHAGVGDALRDPRRAAGARPSLHARRRRGGAAGRRAQRRAVGANVCP